MRRSKKNQRANSKDNSTESGKEWLYEKIYKKTYSITARAYSIARMPCDLAYKIANFTGNYLNSAEGYISSALLGTTANIIFFTESRSLAAFVKQDWLSSAYEVDDAYEDNEYYAKQAALIEKTHNMRITLAIAPIYTFIPAACLLCYTIYSINKTSRLHYNEKAKCIYGYSIFASIGIIMIGLSTLIGEFIGTGEDLETAEESNAKFLIAAEITTGLAFLTPLIGKLLRSCKKESGAPEYGSNIC